MELLDRRIHLHARRTLSLTNVDTWPAPRKHQFYQLDCDRIYTAVPVSVKAYLSALHTVKRERPDINCLEIQLTDLFDDSIRSVLEEVLRTTDRRWSIVLFCLHPENQESKKIISLKHALSILQNVQYLSLVQDPSIETDHDILDNLPSFHQLKGLDIRRWRMHPDALDEFFHKYPFAPLTHGLCLHQRGSKQFSEPVFSAEVRTHLQRLELCFAYFMGHGHDLVRLVAGLSSLPCLATLRLNLTSLNQAYMEPLISLLEWLGTSQCPVVDLAFEHDNDVHLEMFLPVLPNIPKLKTIRLLASVGQDRDLDYLFPVLLEAPLLETIILKGSQVNERICYQLLKFQLEHKPRLFSVQWTTAYQLKEGAGTDKIYCVSILHQTLRNFHRSKEEHPSSFPLSLWSKVIEILGSRTLESVRDSDVDVFSVDACFTVIQELLERPHLLLT